jgi:hypothetical protein
MSEYVVKRVLHGEVSVEYTTDSANDAWNWVMTSQSPTQLVVTNGSTTIRPPKWFLNNVTDYGSPGRAYGLEASRRANEK